MNGPTLTGMTVCSGIGAPEVAAPWIDWRFQSEIAPFPSAVLAHRFPHAVNFGDMTRYQEWPDATLDVLVGGTPCQSFSVAGLRKGLADPRGNLMLTFLAIARRYRPRWIVWENVPGVLSSNEGRDFGAFLGGLGQCGYGWAYRVLDAQYVRTPHFPFAFPQRRRRVFVVGCLGDWARAAAVLFEPEGLRGDPPPRREAGQAVAADVAPSLVSSGRGVERTGDTRGQDPVIAVAGALCRDSFSGGASGRPEGASAGHFVPVAFSSKDHGADAETDLSPTLRAGAHDGSHANAGVPPAIAIQERAVAAPYAVRRLTPLECERLQGFKDGWTAIPMAKRNRDAETEEMRAFFERTRQDEAIKAGLHMAFDGPRYKALGNSWAVNCGAFVFERMRAVETMGAEISQFMEAAE